MNIAFLIWSLIFLFKGVLSFHWKGVPRLRDYMMNTTGSTDGIHVRFARHINGWSRISRVREAPVHVIQGDVMMDRSRGIPVLAYPPQKDRRIDFRKWLMLVGKIGRVTRINLLKSEVVLPAMNHVFAMKKYLKGPVWIHADITAGPNRELSTFDMVDPTTFIDAYRDVFPYAALSVGWVSQNLPPIANQKENRYSWRHILDILEYTFDVNPKIGMETPQEINFVFRTVFVENSLYQILWLLHVRPIYTVTAWLDDTDSMDYGWAGVVKLRNLVRDKSRLYFDIPSAPRHDFVTELNRSLFDPLNLEQYYDTVWNRSDWRSVKFMNSKTQLSTIIESDLSVAFVGAPMALLLSKKHFTAVENLSNSNVLTQRVSGRIHFIPKREPKTFYLSSASTSGLSLFLVPSEEDLRPEVKGGVEVYIGEDGSLFIEDRSNSSLKQYERPKIATQHSLSDCYDFDLLDLGTSIDLRVTVSDRCSGREKKTTLQNIGHVKHISLPVPSPAQHQNKPEWAFVNNQLSSRYVILRKSGEGPVDFILEELLHSNSVRSIHDNCIFMVVVLLLSVLSVW